jgi:hypothetical protein
MSIPAAVAELNNEIAALDKAITEAEKKKARLISVRESLLKEDLAAGRAPAKKGKPGRKPGPAKKAASVRKNAVSPKKTAAKTSAAPKKRVLSAEAKKRIGDAQRKRWAATRASTKAA